MSDLLRERAQRDIQHWLAGQLAFRHVQFQPMSHPSEVGREIPGAERAEGILRLYQETHVLQVAQEQAEGRGGPLLDLIVDITQRFREPEDADDDTDSSLTVTGPREFHPDEWLVFVHGPTLEQWRQSIFAAAVPFEPGDHGEGERFLPIDQVHGILERVLSAIFGPPVH